MIDESVKQGYNTHLTGADKGRDINPCSDGELSFLLESEPT